MPAEVNFHTLSRLNDTMFAIVDIAGTQEKVSLGQKLHVPLLQASAGETVTVKDVLLVQTAGGAIVGCPHVTGASVTFQVLSHGRDEKIVVRKMRRRKRYRRAQGHRQDFTAIEITGIEPGR